jgi:predicted DNA-binding transcriptional regulator YafY
MSAVEGALAKTERALPEKLLGQVRSLQEAITFNVRPSPTLPQSDFLAILSSAVHQQRRVSLRYTSWQGEESEREFDPYGIVCNEGYWYTSGYCHLRHDLRTFRLDRIVALKPDEQSFERPEDFDVLAHVLNAIALGPRLEQVEVVMQTSLEHAREYFTSVMGSLEQTKQGVIFRRAAHQLEWIAHILLTVDFPISSIEPRQLRDMIRKIGQRATQIAGKAP